MAEHEFPEELEGATDELLDALAFVEGWRMVQSGEGAEWEKAGAAGLAAVLSNAHLPSVVLALGKLFAEFLADSQVCMSCFREWSAAAIKRS